MKKTTIIKSSIFIMLISLILIFATGCNLLACSESPDWVGTRPPPISTPVTPAGKLFCRYTNTVSWQPSFGATDYELEFLAFGSHFPIFANTWQTQFTLNEFANFIPTNTYMVQIRAINQGISARYISAPSAPMLIRFYATTQLQSPHINIDSGVLSWQPITSAASYSLYVFEEWFNDYVPLMSAIHSTSINFNAFSGLTVGNRVRVKAEGHSSNGVHFLDSILSNPITITANDIQLPQLARPTNLRQDGRQLRWDANINATMHNVYISRGNTGVYTLLQRSLFNHFPIHAHWGIQDGDSFRVRAVSTYAHDTTTSTTWRDSELSYFAVRYWSPALAQFSNPTNLRTIENNGRLLNFAWDYSTTNNTHGIAVNSFMILVVNYHGEVVFEDSRSFDLPRGFFTVPLNQLNMISRERYSLLVRTYMNTLCDLGFTILDSEFVGIELSNYTLRQTPSHFGFGTGGAHNGWQPEVSWSGQIGYDRLDFFSMDGDIIHSATVNGIRYYGPIMAWLATQNLRVELTTLARPEHAREFDSEPLVVYFRQENAPITNFIFNPDNDREFSWDRVGHLARSYFLRLTNISILQQGISHIIQDRTPSFYENRFNVNTHTGWTGVHMENIFIEFLVVNTLETIYFGSEIFNIAGRQLEWLDAPQNLRIENNYIMWEPIANSHGVHPVMQIMLHSSHAALIWSANVTNATIYLGDLLFRYMGYFGVDINYGIRNIRITARPINFYEHINGVQILFLRRNEIEMNFELHLVQTGDTPVSNIRLDGNYIRWDGSLQYTETFVVTMPNHPNSMWDLRSYTTLNNYIDITQRLDWFIRTTPNPYRHDLPIEIRVVNSLEFCNYTNIATLTKSQTSAFVVEIN